VSRTLVFSVPPHFVALDPARQPDPQHQASRNRRHTLPPPRGYKPEKSLRGTWNPKCATCMGGRPAAITEQGVEMGIADMTKAAYWKDVTVESAARPVLEGLQAQGQRKEQEMSRLAIG